MGGRGSSSGSGGGVGRAGGGTVNVQRADSLISARERSPQEVDQALSVLRDVERDYGVNLADVQLATVSNRGVMAYYDSNDNLAINHSYFDAAKMDAAYDRSVQQGFHPSRGNKSGIEAVTAHEAGHKLTAQNGFGDINRTSNTIIHNASRTLGMSASEVRRSISGYARSNNAEAVAEAFSDVYCNGARASRASREVVNELNNLYRRR